MKSAMRPRIVKVAQKIFRSMYQVYRLCEWELYVFSTPESLRAATIVYSQHGEGAQPTVACLIRELTAEGLRAAHCEAGWYPACADFIAFCGAERDEI